MAISSIVALEAAALWPQGDIRDPLGVWGARLALPADATGGSIKVEVVTPDGGRSASYLYTCYAAIIVQVAGAANRMIAKCRLLTNWPNIDPQPGVQGYAHAAYIDIDGSTDFTQPQTGPFNFTLIQPNDRFILLFDPRQERGQITIMELEVNENIVGLTHSFEAYGYFWDRSVLNAPGGPRHPGSS